ncbi:MAG: double zinc ribbon domain-containing protein [Candidatus Zixiibacteriota bacterium]
MLPNVVAGSSLLKGLVDFFWPPLCLGCGQFDDKGTGVCEHCRKRIIRYEHPICLECFSVLQGTDRCQVCDKKMTPLYAHADYASPMREIVISFKFRGIRLPALVFPPLIIEQYEQRLRNIEADLLIPVPLHRDRERKRGFNQAALLADKLGEILNLPVREDIIVRRRKGKPQSKLEFKKRAENVAQAYEVEIPAQGSERVVVVDDVVTSGATAREVCGELTRAGYTVAAVVAMAHGQ